MVMYTKKTALLVVEDVHVLLLFRPLPLGGWRQVVVR